MSCGEECVYLVTDGEHEMEVEAEHQLQAALDWIANRPKAKYIHPDFTVWHVCDGDGDYWEFTAKGAMKI